MSTIVLYIYKILVLFLPETRFFELKRYILNVAGAKIGKGVKICSSVTIIGNGDLEIGDYCWIGPKTFISTTKPAIIKIGKNVDIAPMTYLGTGSHRVNPYGSRIAGDGFSGDINVGDGVWICAGVFLLPNSNVGSMTIVAPCSVVKGNISEFKLAAGNPCKVIKSL